MISCFRDRRVNQLSHSPAIKKISLVDLIHPKRGESSKTLQGSAVISSRMAEFRDLFHLPLGSLPSAQLATRKRASEQQAA
jgi:hypothetical protein